MTSLRHLARRAPLVLVAFATLCIAPTARATPEQSADLQYYGGVIIPNIKVVAVLWGTRISPQVTSRLSSYFTALTNSVYFDMMAEYNTPSQSIGHGTYVSTVTDSKASTSRELSFTDITVELDARIGDHTLPAPDLDTVYVVYTPRDVAITVNGLGLSCQDYGGYHDYFTRANNDVVLYAVVPDCSQPAAESDAAAACWPQEFTWEVSAHEIAESVTDPIPLGASSAFTGWIDPNGAGAGEIADICSPGSTFTGGVPVATLWSNSANACVGAATAIADDYELDLGFLSGPLAFEVTTKALSGSAVPIALTACGLPAGVTASFNPASVQSGQTSVLTLSAGSGISNRDFFLINIYGTSGATTHIMPATYLPTDVFTMTATPATQSVTGGNPVTFRVTTALASGTTGPITLSIVDLPCADATFNPPSVSAGGSSTLTVTPSAACSGDFKFQVAGSADGLRFALASLELDVTAGVVPTPDAGVTPHPDAAVSTAPDAATAAHADAAMASTPDAAPAGSAAASSGGCAIGARSPATGASSLVILAALASLFSARRRRV